MASSSLVKNGFFNRLTTLNGTSQDNKEILEEINKIQTELDDRIKTVYNTEYIPTPTPPPIPNPIYPTEGYVYFAKEPQTGPLNSLCDVKGIKVGHAYSPELVTGTTVITFEDFVTDMGPAYELEEGQNPGLVNTAVVGVDTPGFSPASSDVLALELKNNNGGACQGLCLSGGSAYGLSAAHGLREALDDLNIGLKVGGLVNIPLVAGSCIFDWVTLPSVDAYENRRKAVKEGLYQNLAKEAFKNSTNNDNRNGSIGAGFGAMSGLFTFRGGVGQASIVDPDFGFTVSALVVNNGVGAVNYRNKFKDGEKVDKNKVIFGTDKFFCGPLEKNGELGNLGNPDFETTQTYGLSGNLFQGGMVPPSHNTVLVVVATDLKQSHKNLDQLATMTSIGLGDAIKPFNTKYDGDVTYAISTSTYNENEKVKEGFKRLPAVPDDLHCLLGQHMQNVAARAAAKAVYNANGSIDTLVGPLPSFKQYFNKN